MDLERTMEFIVEQQAKFFASLQAHEERMARHDERAARTDERLDRLAEDVQVIVRATHKLIEIGQNNQDAIQANRDSIKDLTALAAKHEGKIQQTTDNLNALIQIVDGIVRRSNGGNK